MASASSKSSCCVDAALVGSTGAAEGFGAIEGTTGRDEATGVNGRDAGVPGAFARGGACGSVRERWGDGSAVDIARRVVEVDGDPVGAAVPDPAVAQVLVAAAGTGPFIAAALERLRKDIVVEDDRMIGAAVMQALKDAAYAVDWVTDGETALAAARASLPDLVLSDVMMPKLDGFGLLKALRANERTRQLPVILVSARAGDEAAIEGLDAGADDYLVKPFSARELLARIRAHLGLARQRRELEHELEQRVAARTADVARLTRVLHMLSGINSALVRIADRNQVMAEACRLARNVGGYSLSMVALIDPTTRMARPVAWSGYEFLANPEREFPVADHEGKDSSLMGRVICTGEAMLCEDIETFPHANSGVYFHTQWQDAGWPDKCRPLGDDDFEGF